MADEEKLISWQFQDAPPTDLPVPDTSTFMCAPPVEGAAAPYLWVLFFLSPDLKGDNNQILDLLLQCL